MNLQTHIREDLWLAISNSYQAENYKHAILETMHFLSSVLREKTDLDADGVSLVGQALGGTKPRLKVNKLETETERNIQRGLEQILRGLYSAIRNPRSHERVEDDKNTADAIVFFVNYLLGILAESQQPFTIQNFLSRVFDPDFVESTRYAELLVEEIPNGKRLDTLIEIYRRKTEGDGRKLKFIVKELIAQLTGDQVANFLLTVSEQLKTVQSEPEIRRTLQTLPSEYWPRIDEVARLRIENKLLQSISMFALLGHAARVGNNSSGVTPDENC